MKSGLSIKQDVFEGQTLKDTLIEILALKRLEIARQQIQKYLNTDAHSYAKYMSVFGKMLAIHGAGNIQEHLAQPLNQTQCLTRFFTEYTVDCIIDSINAQIKKSQSFREKIIDWLQDQVADWNAKMDDQALQDQVAKVNDLIENKTIHPTRQSLGLKFVSLNNHWMQAGILQQMKNTDAPIEDIMSHFTTKQWLEKNSELSFAHDTTNPTEILANRTKIMSTKQALQSLLTECPSLLHQPTEWPNTLSQLDKREAIAPYVNDSSTADQVIQGTKTAQE